MGSPSTSPDRLSLERQRRDIFERALNLPQSERTAFVRRECGEDAALRNSVLRLVAASGNARSGSLDRPIYNRPPAEEALPRTIGDYTVLRHVGSGGTSNVYACTSPAGETVAVKVLHADMGAVDLQKRAGHEWSIHSALTHPNVCRLLGLGAARHGSPFIVMELVEGERLDVYAERRSLNTGERLRLFASVLAGVEYFHRQRVIHRDLKPANILVTDSGQVRILDFGIARITEHTRGFTGVGPTKTAVPMLTERYASPEQLDKRRSGLSSDIFSLGVILYQLLTGSHPFESGGMHTTAALVEDMRLRSPAAPSRINSNIPPGVDGLVLKAIRFEPAQRYKSAGEFLEELGRQLEQMNAGCNQRKR